MSAGDEHERRLKRAAVEAAVLVPNLLLLAIIVVYLLITTFANGRVGPLVATDGRTARKIVQLERKVSRDPSDANDAIVLARLYERAGELPWAYDALRSAEQHGKRDLLYRMKLGLAYLEIGRNRDGLRVLQRSLEACDVQGCKTHLRVKLEVFTRLAQLMIERRIDARRDRAAARALMREVLMPIENKPDEVAKSSEQRGKSGSGASPAHRPAGNADRTPSQR